MGHKIFLVHGIGQWKQGWSTPYQKLITDAYDNYPTLKRQQAFSDRFIFEEVDYDSIFRIVAERMAQEGQNVTDILGKGVSQSGEAGVMENLAKFASNADDDEFAFTHVQDLLLYRFTSLVRDAVIDWVSEAIRKDINTTPRRWSIIAHSMGTSVAHDVIEQLSRPSSNGTPGMPSGQNNCFLLAMLANVCRPVESKFELDVYTSPVRPRIDENKGLVAYYYNINHRYDPVPRFKPFRPDDRWLSPKMLSFELYKNIEPTLVTSRQTHDLDHYLADPEVNYPILQCLCEERATQKTMQEKANAIAKYREGSVQGKFDSYKKSIDEVLEPSSWSGFLQALLKFRALIQQV